MRKYAGRQKLARLFAMLLLLALLCDLSGCIVARTTGKVVGGALKGVGGAVQAVTP